MDDKGAFMKYFETGYQKLTGSQGEILNINARNKPQSKERLNKELVV